mmetsp:Transcript_46632/g.141260  ORF Transcript_46632/g.141260 Transcript_46632/m.141260 type:complete len:225 (-) Transcript_46632:4361-5035(-)
MHRSVFIVLLRESTQPPNKFLLVVEAPNAVVTARFCRRTFHQGSGVRHQLRNIRAVMAAFVVAVVLHIIKKIRTDDSNNSSALAAREGGQFRPSDDALAILNGCICVAHAVVLPAPTLGNRSRGLIKTLHATGDAVPASACLTYAPHALPEHPPPPLPSESAQDARIVHPQVHKHGRHNLVLSRLEGGIAPLASVSQPLEPPEVVQVVVTAKGRPSTLAEGGRG